MNILFYWCVNDCGSGKCGCTKTPPKCFPVCQKCHGNCLNGIPVLENGDEDVEVVEVTRPKLMEELDGDTKQDFDEEDDLIFLNYYYS